MRKVPYQNIKWKRELKAAFSAPQPKWKEEFLRTLRYPKLSRRGFFYTQLQYIRKPVWLLSLAVFMGSVLVAGYVDDGECWKTAAVLPFMALLMSLEIARSSSWNMAELEMSCRYSLQQVILARLLIFGVMDTLFLIPVFGIVGIQSEFGIFRTALYLLTPYMLTAALSLWILRKFRRRESVYGCAAVTCAVSLLHDMAGSAGSTLYDLRFTFWWGAVITAAVGILCVQFYQMMKKVEGQLWNYAWIE